MKNKPLIFVSRLRSRFKEAYAVLDKDGLGPFLYTN